MFRNMACSLIRSLDPNLDGEGEPKVRGRIVTTVPKAKELRPFVEKLVTLAKKAIPIERQAAALGCTADRGSDEWQEWRKSSQWHDWAAAIAPAVQLRRRAFAMLRDRDAVAVLFEVLAPQFEDRQGGYTRIVRLAKVRLGDAGAQALIEFVGERDRKKPKRRAAPVVEEEVVESTPAEEPIADAVASEDVPAEDGVEATEGTEKN